MPKETIYNKIKGYMNVVRQEDMDVFTKEEIDKFIKVTSLEVDKRLRKII